MFKHTNNILSTQRNQTSGDWNNSKSACTRKMLIDRITMTLNVRANEARWYSEEDYQRMIKQAAKIQNASTAELTQYAIDLGIEIVHLS